MWECEGALPLAQMWWHEFVNKLVKWEAIINPVRIEFNQLKDDFCGFLWEKFPYKSLIIMHVFLIINIFGLLLFYKQWLYPRILNILSNKLYLRDW